MKGPTIALCVLLVSPLLAAQRRFVGQQLGAPATIQGAPLAADMDGDGHADLVSDVASGAVIRLRLQRGDGAGWVLSDEDQLLFTYNASVAATADVDLDGDLDAIVHDNGQGSVAVNDGDGHFSGGAGFTYVHTYPGPLACADLDLDGVADLVAIHPFPMLASVLLGNGTGGFGAAASVAAIKDVAQFALADLTGDDVPDLVLPDANSVNVQLAVGDGAGGFAAPFAVPAGLKSSTVAVGDVNADGVPDLVAGRLSDGPGFVSVMRSIGNGLSAPTLFEVDSNVADLALADMDHDGFDDIVVTLAYEAPGVQVLRSTAGGTIFPLLSEHATGHNPDRARVADFEGDGELDVLFTTGSASLLRGVGGGGFEQAPEVPAHAFARFLLMADVTGDGVADIVAATSIAGAPALPSFVTLHAGDGQGGLLAGVDLPAGGGACGLAAADFDGDGRPEIVVAEQNTHDLLLLHEDGGTWSSVMPGGWPWYLWNQDPRSVDTGDFDGDGRTDLLVAKDKAHAVSVVLASGPNQFHAPKELDFGFFSAPNQALAGDFDDDGDLDAALGDLGSNAHVALLLNDGAGGLTVAGSATTALSYEPSIGVGDFDLDGHLDVVSGGLDVLLGDGAGMLHSTGASVSPSLTKLAVRDLDGDGLVDVIGVRGDGLVAVARGDGAGALVSDIGILAASSLTACAVGDLDGDLLPDVVAAGSEPRLTIHLNLATSFAWAQLGGGLAGGHGTPRLSGYGALTGGSTVQLVVDQGAPFAASVLVLGLTPLGAPFKGGVMWPHPDLVVAGLPLDANGFLALTGVWPAGLPASVQLWAQVWIPDAAGPHGWSATNGLKATTP